MKRSIPFSSRFIAGAFTAALVAGVAITPAWSAELIIGQSVDAIGFDPTQFATGNQVHFHQLYDPLVRTDADGMPVPALAESWERSPDDLTVTLKLRDAKFHDGRPITADDVVFTVERYQTESVGANLYPRLKTIEQTTAIDSKTVQMKLSAPTPGLFDLLNVLFIQNKDKVDEFSTTDAGSGRFKVASWTPGENFVLERNPDHWDNANTKLDRIEVRTIPDKDAGAAALQAGDIDLLLGADYITSEQFRDSPGFKVERPPAGPVSFYLATNTSRKPFDNKLFRQAISYALDRQKVVEIAYGGVAERTCQPWASGHWAYDPTFADGCSFDLEKAKRLLEQSGVGPVTISVNTAIEGYSPGSVATAQILKEDLAKIGVTLDIATYEQAKARQLLLASEFDMLLHIYVEGGNDPQVVLPSGFLGPNGRSKFTSPEYEELTAMVNGTTDQAKRKEGYAKISRLINDEAFINIIAHRFRPYPMKDTVQGLNADNNGFPVLSGVTVQ